MTRDEPGGVVPQTLPDDSSAGFGAATSRGGIGEAEKGILHPSMWSIPFADLSAGNQRRTQLAVALATHPAVLIIDEPTNYLDLETMDALEDALRDWRETLIVAQPERFVANAIKDDPEVSADAAEELLYTADQDDVSFYTGPSSFRSSTVRSATSSRVFLLMNRRN